MFRAVIDRRSLPQGRRILVISDVHGALPHLQGLLRQAEFSGEDVLILLGDMLEKGPYSLDTLRYVMHLCETHTVFPVLGNCDCWHRLLFDGGESLTERCRDYILHSMPGFGKGLLRQMCEEMAYPLAEDMDMDALRVSLRENFAREFGFLYSLPHVIETPHYTFVHGGLPEGAPESWDAADCMKNDFFMQQGRKFDKWQIVGHTPVVLYCGDFPCADPIAERGSHIVSIDGGCVLKDDGQLNALIIPFDGSEDFSFTAWDPFPVRRAKTRQSASEKSFYVRWGDNRVRVLSRGKEFSHVRHERTGYELDVLTKYLYGEGESVTCNDCTDYVLPVEPGDALRIVEETSRGVFCKRGGVSGWYFGTLEDDKYVSDRG